MAIIERDIVLQSKTSDGTSTIDMPITRLGNIEDTADIIDEPDTTDFFPIIDTSDSSQMKKLPYSTINDQFKQVTSAVESAANTAKTALDTANDAKDAAGSITIDDGTLTQKGIVQLSDSTASTSTTLAATPSAVKASYDLASEAKQAAKEAQTAADNAQQTAQEVSDALSEMNSTISATPTQSGTLTYTGSAQTPSWNGYDSTKMTVSVTAQTAAGTYTASFTPLDGYKWSDGTTTAKTVNWTIGRASVAVPTVSSNPTYTGSTVSPTWSGYDSAKMTIGGTSSATTAGSYSATFTPTSNYQWSDGTTTAKSVSWTVNKASGSLTISKTTMSLSASALTGTITVTRSGDGTISASSSNTSVATVSLSGTTVTVTAKASGSATITISVAAGTNYTAPSSKTCAVTVSLPSTTLASNTPAVIQETAQSGKASSYWAVGDKIGIALSGTVGALSLSGTYYAFIIGFNHNSTYEGSNTIHFQFGKTSSGTDIAFVDSNYNSTGSSAGFRMNTSNTNSGGWKSSYMRSTICASFLSAMPTAWQNVIASCTKYSDNTGGGSNTASYVTSTSDKIWLLSEYEVQGARSYANSAEQNYQKQYTYYANGNSKIKYQHSSTSSACFWWLRSVYANLAYYFCFVYTDGSADNYGAYYSIGFAPGFSVA